MVRLTRHFVENWKARVGGEPTLSQVRQILQESVKVQGTRNLFAAHGQPFRMLAIYCHFERNLLIKVDEIQGTAVTVLSINNAPRRQRHDQGRLAACH